MNIVGSLELEKMETRLNRSNTVFTTITDSFQCIDVDLVTVICRAVDQKWQTPLHLYNFNNPLHVDSGD